MIATETHDIPNPQIAPTPLKMQNASKMAFDCLILIIVGFVGYSFGHDKGHNNGKLSLAAPIKEKDQQIQDKDQQILEKDQQILEKDQQIQDKDGQITTLNLHLKAYQDADDPDPVLTPPYEHKRAPELPKPVDGSKPVSGLGPDGLPIQGGVNTPTAPGPVVTLPDEPKALPLEPALNDDMERLFRSLQSEASGNPRVDDLIEGKLEANLSSLEGRHNSEIMLWKKLSAEHAATKLKAGRVLETMFMIRKNKGEENTQEARRKLLETMTKQNESLSKESDALYLEIRVKDGILANSTNQIVSAKQVLEDFKTSRTKFETDQTASQNTIEAAQAADLQKYSDALARINSLNGETASLRDEIKTLSNGYSLHVTLSSTNWITKVFEEAKEHAKRIPNKSKSLLDGAIIEQGKLEGERVEKDNELKDVETLLNNLTIFEDLVPEGKQAVEAKKGEIQEKIDLLNADKDALTKAQDENSGDLIKLKADYSEAVKEQDDALVNIKLNERRLEGLFTKPVELEPSPTLIGAIESELSKTTNNLNIVGTLINNRETKIKENTTKLKDFKRKKGELEKSAFGDESETKKRAAIQELATILPQMVGLQVEIKAIDLQLEKKKEENSKLLDIQAHLEELMAFLKPGKPAPPKGKIVLVPQGDNILQSAFIVKQVPPMQKKTLFGGKSSEYSKFLKFHQEQVARLQYTMQAVRVCNELKAGSGATDSEKYDNQILKYFANSLIESSQTSGTSEVTLEVTGLSGKLIVYGYARSESGTMKIYVRELGSKPDRVHLERGIDDHFSFLKKK